MGFRGESLRCAAQRYGTDAAERLASVFIGRDEWNERLHPRHKDGKFARSPDSGVGSSESEEKSERKSERKSAENKSASHGTTKPVSAKAKKAKTLENHSKYIPQYQDEFKSRLDEWEKGWANSEENASAIKRFRENVPRYESSIKEAVDKNEFSSRTDALSIMGILSDGRMKTQIETGKTHGYKDRDKRIQASNDMFNGGDPMNINDDEYEIYGYLGNAKRADMYGDCRIVFKKDQVIDRTTLTIGDSLEQRASGAWQVPTMATDPKILSYNVNPFESEYYTPKETLKHTDDIFKSIRETGCVNSSGDYVELQIHGGVSLSDIEYIEVPASDWRRPVIETLAKKNGVSIKWKK